MRTCRLAIRSSVVGLGFFIAIQVYSSVYRNVTTSIWNRPIGIDKDSQQAISSWADIPVSEWNIDQIMDYLDWTNNSACLQQNMLGGDVVFGIGLNGQKSVCLDSAVRPLASYGGWPITVKNKSAECLVYSFGINNEWSFDEAMESFGCRVFAFDPSMNATNHNHSSKIHFYNIGLYDRDETISVTADKNWTMMSLDSIYRRLLRHESRIIDYLKIDIENWEWAVLPQILSSGVMDRVRQLGVEVHVMNENKCKLEDIRKRIMIVKSLEDYGLVRFDSKYNPWSYQMRTFDNFDWYGPTAYEIAWYNSKLDRRHRVSKRKQLSRY